jgi:hypothetical protein
VAEYVLVSASMIASSVNDLCALRDHVHCASQPLEDFDVLGGDDSEAPREGV